MFFIQQKRPAVVLVMAMILLFGSSCEKTKINSLLQPSGAEVNTNSSIRLFNFYNFNLDVTINNVPLTSYSEGVGNGTGIGLSLFPSGSWQTTDNGNPFFVPSNLIAKDRTVHIQLSISSTLTTTSGLGASPTGVATVDTVLTDDPLNPKDYYATPTGHLLVIPRNTEAPVQPDHFKIRVINLGSPTDQNNIVGKVGLTYSDGSQVDPQLDTVSPGNISPYIDLPYGAYMFKLFCSNGNGGYDFTRQVAELPLLAFLTTCGLTEPLTQEELWPKIRTFAPGGTYSIVVTETLQVYPPCNTGQPFTANYFNGYRVITEQIPGANVTFARMDAVNALPVVPVSLLVDGQPLGSKLAYAAHTDYGIFVQGTHTVQAVDTTGNVLVTKSITLAPYDNYTAWVCQNPSGVPDICFANTDMSSTLYQTVPVGNVAPPNATNVIPPTDDGTDGSLRVNTYPYSWQTRFLNLTADVPFVTFCNDASTFPAASLVGNVIFNGTPQPEDSTNFANATINLAIGAPAVYNPFLIFSFSIASTSAAQGAISPAFPTVIRAYASNPGPPAEVPGIYIGLAGGLSPTAYISNPAMYTGLLPVSEPGIYTTALIGKANNATSSIDQVRFIILKHNK